MSEPVTLKTRGSQGASARCLRVLAVLVVLAFAAAGCGGGGPASPSAADESRSPASGSAGTAPASAAAELDATTEPAGGAQHDEEGDGPESASVARTNCPNPRTRFVRQPPPTALSLLACTTLVRSEPTTP